MNTKVLLSLRSLFVVLCCFIGGLTALTTPSMRQMYMQSILAGFSVGCLGVFLEYSIRNISLRALMHVLFGIFLGSLIAFILLSLPLLDYLKRVAPQYTLIAQFAFSIVPVYLAIITILKKENEIGNLFGASKVPQKEFYTAKTVLDITSLVDGRVIGICENHFLPSLLVIPRFVLQELENMVKSDDQIRSVKGQKGIATFKALTQIKQVALKVEEVFIDRQEDYLARILAFTKLNKAKLLTTDFSIAQKAESQGVEWLNLSALTKALSPELSVGESFEVELVKKGKEESQAIGYLCDGSMVVVNEAANMIGRAVTAEVVSILPSAGGKMVFARMS